MSALGRRTHGGAFPEARSGRTRYRPRPRAGVYGIAAQSATLRRFGVLKGRTATAAQELKFHDVDVDQAAADISAGVILNTSSINLIAQGVTESTRVGRKCTVLSIGWRGVLIKPASAAATVSAAITVRLMLVQDKQANGAAPTVAGVAGILESANFQSFNNLSNKGRYRTIADKSYDMNAQAAAGDGAANDSGSVNCTFNLFKPCNIPLEFSGTSGTIDELRSNNLFILMIASTTASNVSLDSKIRLRFSDG